MSQRQSLVRVYALLLVACLEGGCFAAASVAPKNPQKAEFFNELLRHRKLVVHPGALDVGNRYRSNVQVFAEELGTLAQGGSGQCSGSLIGPRLVLTAAHCVCPRRSIQSQDLDVVLRTANPAPKDGSVTRALVIKGRAIDFIAKASDCVKEVVVTTVIYEPPVGGSKVGTRTREYEGTVRVHPALELLYEHEKVIWSNADLAVIFLAAPFQGGPFPVYTLAEAEVKAGDRITLVGHGQAGSKVPFGKRRFGENEVAWVNKLETGSVEFVAGAQRLEGDRVATHVDGGDSGGGCFKAGDDKVLIGVIGARAEAANGDVFSVVTSVYPHQKWLRNQLEEARGLPTP